MDATLRQSCLQQEFSANGLPLLAESLDALLQLLKSQGASPQRFLAAAKPADWLKKAVSLQHLLDSGRLDGKLIDAALQEIADPALSANAVIDRFLLPYLLLTAARPQLAGQPPVWLVDALAAMIAVDADNALLDVAAADEQLDGESGCLTVPWLARQTLAARWLARQLTQKRLWRVLSGAIPWSEAIDATVLAEAHAIHNGASPQAVGTTHEEDDVFALMDAFHGLTCVRKRQRNVPTCQALVPAGGGLIWQLAAGRLHTAGDAVSLTQSAAAGYLEPPLSALPVPVPLGAGLLAAGWQSLRLELDDADAVDELLDSLLDLALDPLPPQTLDGLGFRIVPLAIP